LITARSPAWWPGRVAWPAHVVVAGRGGKLSGMSADDPLDPAEGGIVAATAAVLALRDLLVEKGIITADEFDAALDRHSAFIVEQLRQRRGQAEEDIDPRSW
jgi:hypothetical protein